MTLTEAALARPRFTAVFALALAVIGLSQCPSHPSQEDPEFTIREAVVTTQFPGMSAERIEDLITREVEEAARKIPEVKRIRSSSRAGVSVVRVELYDRYFDLDPIWADLRNEMEDLRRELPKGTRGPFVNDDFGRVAVATIAITGAGFGFDELHAVAKRLRQELYLVAGTSQVDIFGEQERAIFVEVDTARLGEYDVAPGALFAALSDQNVILPGGRFDVGGYDFLVEPTGRFKRLEEVGEVRVSTPDGGALLLRDLATLRFGYEDPPEQPVLFDGEPALSLGVSMVAGENIVEYGERLAARVRAFETTLPVGLRLSFATFQPSRVEESIDDFLGNLYQTIGVVLLVVVLFLGIRTGLIVGLIVPFTILASLLVMRLVGIPLHSVSIAALIISLGLLVDNGIVMAEDIRTRIEAGEGREDAARNAGRELAMPLLTSSLTTILAFMPLMLAQNSAGEYTRALSQVIMITLLCSWILALFVTPLACVWFVRPGRAREEGAGPERYGRFLRGILARPIRFLGAMALAFGLAIFLFRFVAVQFFPDSSRNQFLVYFELAAGASVEQTAAEVERFAHWLRDPAVNPEIESHIGYVGSGGPRFVLGFAPPQSGDHQAVFVVNLRSLGGMESVMQRARRELAAHFPEVRARVNKLGTGPSEPGLVELRVGGRDRERLMAIANEVRAAFLRIPHALDVRDDWGNRTRKIVVDVEQARARRTSITSADIAESLSGAFDGRPVSDFSEGDETIPIVVRPQPSDLGELDRIHTLPIFDDTNLHAVPLAQIADFDLAFEYGNIERRDLERTVTVAGRHAVWTAAEFAAAIQDELADLELPPGYQLDQGGELESSREANSALFASLPLCFGAIVLLLVWQFDSVRRPLIIFLTIPLTLIGATLGLLATRAPFGFMETLGMLSLAGIVINNAIVLIDRIDLEIAAGKAPYQAILSSCMRRLRPIVMTTLTTIVGLLPLMLFGGELWFGMAVVIAAGLAGGTLLTLGVVPVLYALFFRVRAESA
ncbi:MAG: efflux RND transporter permease subunit [Myxococcota bacterium]|nr:efflux RND transporter permease subunit [Myxococcota bacterium]